MHLDRAIPMLSPMLLLLAASSAFAFHAPAASRGALARSTVPLLQEAATVAGGDAWASIAAVANPDRSQMVAALDQLKDEGKASLWRSGRLAPRPVSLRELCQTTSLEASVLDPSASEYSLDDISGTFVKVLLGCTVVGLLIQVLPLPDTIRFTGTYLIGGVPIAILAIGSTAPGILFAPFEMMKSKPEKEELRERRARHEAAHLLCAYCLGVPVESVSVGESPEVVCYDETAANKPGTLVPAESLNSLAVVALAGLMAEAVSDVPRLPWHLPCCACTYLLTLCRPRASCLTAGFLRLVHGRVRGPRRPQRHAASRHTSDPRAGAAGLDALRGAAGLEPDQTARDRAPGHHRQPTRRQGAH